MNNQRVVPVQVDDLDQPIAYYVTSAQCIGSSPEQQWNDEVGEFGRQFDRLRADQLQKITRDQNAPAAATLAAHLCLTKGDIGNCIASGAKPISHL